MLHILFEHVFICSEIVYALEAFGVFVGRCHQVRERRHSGNCTFPCTLAAQTWLWVAWGSKALSWSFGPSIRALARLEKGMPLWWPGQIHSMLQRPHSITRHFKNICFTGSTQGWAVFPCRSYLWLHKLFYTVAHVACWWYSYIDIGRALLQCIYKIIYLIYCRKIGISRHHDVTLAKELLAWVTPCIDNILLLAEAQTLPMRNK